MSIHIHPQDQMDLLSDIGMTAGGPVGLSTLMAETVVVNSNIPRGKMMMMMPRRMDPSFRGGPEVGPFLGKKYVVRATSFKSCGVADDEARQQDFLEFDPAVIPGLVGKWVEDNSLDAALHMLRSRLNQFDWVEPGFFMRTT